MSKRKLLLADDSITIQKVVNLTFADEGIEVIAVGDGDSAMRKFDEFMPDLVMADVNMPGLNGYEVCRIIKNTEETQHIPVILLVGSFEPFDENEAKEVGADDFLTKPFQSIRQLVNKVTDLLNRSEKSATDTANTENPPPSVVDSFAETLQFDKQEDLPEESADVRTSNDFELGRSISNGFDDRPTEISSDFGDAGMDDEMIETSPANDYVSGSDSVYQAETTIDYAKTQPLNAEDLKGFEMISGGNAEQQQSSENYEVQPPITERSDEPDERSEPASFDEEARKLDQTEDYEAPQSYRESQNDETPQNSETPKSDEEPENISETEPQIDYYLPNEPEFEKELSDAETLAPEVSYEAEQPREANFSQATIEAEDETAPEAEVTSEKAETPSWFAEDEPADFDKTEQAVRESEPEIVEEKTPETFAANFVEEPQTEEPETTEKTAESGTWEHPVNFSDTEIEPDKTEQVEEAQTKEPEPEAATFEQSETEPAEVEEPEVEEAKVEEPETEEPETEEKQENFEAEESRKDFGTIEETPIYFSENAPALDFDDGDLLELPPLVEETGIRPQAKAEALVPEIVAAAAPVAEPESKITLTKTVAESEIALSFPPELIEAIAQAVAEKISARTMTDILPHITELVMRKLAEENQESKK